ncbi:hypothetical protein CEUSTIGMA_g2162.t1 [Chlamydomonas eustigma]|uniref:Uncharacterized protein n=1 Tax=Chlamydomonas eustigma TaxID=1157962 RepID=A0A250WV44_9CHLO|nr:hypothetical protein CEUSTIGMA_g2162.t1 [Chlamydomonas eustigma]|eukprot:GAX74714.1 hypothetical protein CEUSTIGMA_g2162.t1 [Chlamydomonas eustigma]
MSLDHLWWTSVGAIHSLLQGIQKQEIDDKAQKLFDDNYVWILNGASSFLPPGESSKKLLNDDKVSLKGKKFVIEPLLRPATLQLSIILDLDELQTHILLKRWLKDTGQDSLVAKASSSSPVSISLDAMLQVLTYYHEERLMLLKSAQLILLEGLHNSVYFSKLSQRLVKDGLEDKVFSCLRSNIDVGRSSSNWPGSDAVLNRMNSIMKALGPTCHMGWLSTVQTCILDQVLKERCELMSSLLLLYKLPLKQKVTCSSHRVLELIRLVGCGMFSAGEFKPSSNLAQSDQGCLIETAREVSEQCACMLLLCVLDPSAYISLTSSAPPAPSAPSSRDDIVPLGGKVRDVHNELRSWRGTKTNAALLLTWSAIIKLVEPYDDLGESCVEEFQERAFLCGGFTAISDSLNTQSASLSTALGFLHRRLVLDAVCVMSTAFDLGPTQLTSGVLSQLFELLSTILAGDPELCDLIWDDSLDLTMPVRAMLKEAALLFPADLTLFLKLLNAVSAGPASSAAAYTYLQSVPHMSILHDASLQRVLVESEGGRAGSVILSRATAWPQAPSISTLALPQGVEGTVGVVPPSLCDARSVDSVMVVWEVRGSHRSFGQLLMLGRACHCILELQQCLQLGQAFDSETVRDFEGIMCLMTRLCEHSVTAVQDLATLGVDQAGTGRKHSWFSVMGEGVSVFMSKKATEMSSANTLSTCIRLLNIFAKLYPIETLDCLQQSSTFCPRELHNGSPAGLVRAEDRIVCLSKLSTFQPPESFRAFSGILPEFHSYIVGFEAKDGQYTVTLAFLELLNSLLIRGQLTHPMPGYILFVLHELLPSLPSLPYRAQETRWQLCAAALQVLNLAVETGSFHSGPDPNQTSQPIPAMPHQELKITVIAAHILTQLILHGASLLSPFLPPLASELDALRQSSPDSSEVSALEKAVCQILALIPVIASAVKVINQEVPVEEFLFHGLPDSRQPSPAILLASYVAYVECNFAKEKPQETIQYLALNAVIAMRALVSRPVHRMTLKGLSMSHIITADCPFRTSLVQLFRPEQAFMNSELFLLAVDLLVASIQDNLDFLHVLLYPSNLDQVATQGGYFSMSQPDSKALATHPESQGWPEEDCWSALDGLAAFLEKAEEICVSQPEVLCHALRAVCAIWKHQSVLSHPIRLLRLESKLWERSMIALIKKGAHQENPWMQLMQAYAWQILTLEARSSLEGSIAVQMNPGMDTFESLMDSGVVLEAIHSSSVLPKSCGLVRQLCVLLQCCYLEIGACFLGGAAGREGHQHQLSWPLSEFLAQEYTHIRSKCCEEGIQNVDFSKVHNCLQQLSVQGAYESQNIQAFLENEEAAFYILLQKHSFGSTLLNFSSTLQSLGANVETYGPTYLLSSKKLEAMLGPWASHLASWDSLRSCMEALSEACSLANAQLQTLRAASAYVIVAQKNPTLEGPGQKADTRSQTAALLQAAAAAAASNIAQLLDLSSSTEWTAAVKILLPPNHLMDHCTEVAVCSCKLLLHLLGCWTPSHNSTAKNRSKSRTQLPQGGQLRPPRTPEARTLFPASPSPRRCDNSNRESIAETSPTRDENLLLTLPLSVCHILTTWLRSVDEERSIGCSKLAVDQITDSLCGSALLAIKCFNNNIQADVEIPSHVLALQSLQSCIKDALPLVCRLITSGRTVQQQRVGVQLISVCIGGLLPVQDWLPTLRYHLDLPALLLRREKPTSMHHTQVAEDVGVTQLATLVALHSEGAQLLYDQNIFDELTLVCRHLLSAQGCGLAPFNSLEIPITANGAPLNAREEASLATRPMLSGMAEASPSSSKLDLSSAYVSDMFSNYFAEQPAHQQWCATLSLCAVLIRSLGEHLDVEDAVVGLLAVMEPRLLLSCLPPTGLPMQPLTLGALQELECVLFLLIQSSRFSGTLQLMLPGSLARFKSSVSAFVTFSAQPNTVKGFTLHCPPLSQREWAMAGQGAGFTCSEGWFCICSNGAKLSDICNTSTQMKSLLAQASYGHNNAYSFRLAELMYTCIYHSILFIRATTPQVFEGEVISLGHMFPKQKTLVALQDQCLSVLYSMADAPQPTSFDGGDNERIRFSHIVIKVLHALSDMLDAVGYPPGRANVERCMRDHLSAVDAALSSGDIIPSLGGSLRSPQSHSGFASVVGLLYGNA